MKETVLILGSRISVSVPVPVSVCPELKIGNTDFGAVHFAPHDIGSNAA